jgi:hypothetical protein
MRQRRLPGRRPGLGQAHARLEELAVLLDQRHQRDRDLEQACRQPDHPIEGVLGRGVEQVGLTHGGQPTGVGKHAGQLGALLADLRPPSTTAGDLVDPATTVLATKPDYRLKPSPRNRHF